MRQLTIKLLALSALVTSSALGATSWNLSNDYSGTSNPIGAWSYGRKWTVQAAAMDLFTVKWGSCGWYLGNAGGGVAMWATSITPTVIPVADGHVLRPGNTVLSASFLQT